MFRSRVVRLVRRELIVEDQMKHDRAWRDAEAARVASDAEAVRHDDGRLAALEAAWDRAVAADHPHAAGELATQHHQALVDDAAARAKLDHARPELASADERLAGDRQRLSRFELRTESLVDRTLRLGR